jgi:hypothetical protein
MGMAKTQVKRLVAKTSKRCVILSDGTKLRKNAASYGVKINTVCKYNSPTFGLKKLDCTYHNKYS